MTDLELNIAIVKVLYPGSSLIERYGMKGSKVMIVNDSVKSFSGSADYCGSWDDLMPLVIEHEIDLNRQYTNGKNWLSGKCIINVGSFESSNENPQRALAECLLKVLTQ